MDNRVEQCADAVAADHVRRYLDSGHAGVVKLSQRGLDGVGSATAVGQGDVGAKLPQGQGGPPAQLAAGAGDQGNLAVEPGTANNLDMRLSDHGHTTTVEPPPRSTETSIGRRLTTSGSKYGCRSYVICARSWPWLRSATSPARRR